MTKKYKDMSPQEKEAKKAEFKAKRDALVKLSEAIELAWESGELEQTETKNESIIAVYAKKLSCSPDQIKGSYLWNEEGMKVKKGEKALCIWGRPKRVKGAKEPVAPEVAEATGETESEKKYKLFPLSYVFHVGQVEPMSEKHKAFFDKKKKASEKKKEVAPAPTPPAAAAVLSNAAPGELLVTTTPAPTPPVTPLLDIVEESAAPVEEKGIVKEVFIHWCEGKPSYPSEESFTLEEANEWLVTIANDLESNGGYNKVKYTATLTNGETYEGRFDVRPAREKQENSYNELCFLASMRCFMKWETGNVHPSNLPNHIKPGEYYSGAKRDSDSLQWLKMLDLKDNYSENLEAVPDPPAPDENGLIWHKDGNGEKFLKASELPEGHKPESGQPILLFS